MLTWRRTTWRLLARRSFTVVALASYLVTALGVPLPVVEAKDTSTPFPCQDHACGCRTAEQCWTGCCCFTPAQRESWARSHGIEPPPSSPSTGGWRTTRARDQSPKPVATSCCKPGKSSCEAEPTDSCCKAEKQSVRWAVGIQALRCQGHGTAWVAAGAALPPPALLTWQPYPAPAGWVLAADTFASPSPARPSVPPPRS